MKGDERIQTVEERANLALLCDIWNGNIIKEFFCNGSCIIVDALVERVNTSFIAFIVDTVFPVHQDKTGWMSAEKP